MRKIPRCKKIICLALLLFLFICSFQILKLIQLPLEIDIIKGDIRNLNIFFPFSLEVNEDSEEIVRIVSSDDNRLSLSLRNSYNLEPINNGIAKLKLKFLGIFSIKDIQVNVVNQSYLIPGGEAIGVKLNTRGVLVVATSEIVGVDGKTYNPAKNAGIRVGDSITAINGIKIKDADHVIELLNNIQDNKVKIEIERNNVSFTTEVLPVKSKQDNNYRLGIWVRDKTAGIGTLTFYDPKTKKFGALGHAITDADTGTLLKAGNGEIMKAQVSSIEQGKKGSPGELRGMFFESDDVLGKIENNTSFGIFGTIYDDNKYFNDKKALPVALRSEVKPGKAHILANIEDDEVTEYEVEILKLEKQNVPQAKSMIIKVTDHRLINKTGGIVQGMSGSPIIQNGKIIGAVTHVFVNDPTKGYGIYIEWMLREAGIYTDSDSEFAENN